MPKKEETTARKPAQRGKQSAQDASQSRARRPATSSKSSVSVGRDVQHSIIIALSGIRLFPDSFSEHIRQYRKQPSQLVLDLAWICVFAALVMSVAYLSFVFLYYG